LTRANMRRSGRDTAPLVERRAGRRPGQRRDASGLHFEELLEEAFRPVDEGKFGEDGPIDQAATDAWAARRKDEYRLD
jgi:hypothetical protein